jgi:hypothetical protein
MASEKAMKVESSEERAQQVARSLYDFYESEYYRLSEESDDVVDRKIRMEIYLRVLLDVMDKRGYESEFAEL